MRAGTCRTCFGNEIAFWFDTNGANFEFRAGQHADFVFTHPCMGSESDNSRTFSLASSPHYKEPIMIAIPMRKTAFKSSLKAVALGAKFIVSRPRGTFTQHSLVSPSHSCFLLQHLSQECRFN